MALALLDVFFTKEQLGRSLVTNKDGRDLLDPNIIEGIRCELCNITARNVIGLALVAINYYVA